LSVIFALNDIVVQRGDDELQLNSCENHRYTELIKCKVKMITLLARKLRN